MARYCWRANPVAALAALIVPLPGAGLPVVQTIFNGLLVGSIPAAIAGGPASAAAGRTVDLLIVVVALLAGGMALGYSSNLIFSFLGDRFALEGRRAVTDALGAPAGIAHLEDPALADEVSFVLAREREQIWRSAPSFAYYIFNNWAQSLGSVIILATFGWWLPFVALPAWLLDWRHGAGYARGNLFGGQKAASGVRRASYFRQMTTGLEAAKEIRAFGLGAWAVSRYKEQWDASMVHVWVANRRGMVAMFLAAVAKALAGLVILGLVADAALDGRISLAALAIYTPAALAVLQLGYMGDANTYLTQASNLARRARRLELGLRRSFSDLQPGADSNKPAAGRPEREIKFEGVHFSYPGTNQRVLRGLDLIVPAGHSLAVVGDNGAGKTTLIKLLCRLYEPDAGQITVDGTPLSDFDLDEWRRRIGVIFQDFVRWELPLADNVAFGLSSRPETYDLLEAALSDAGASDLLADRTDRLSIVLSRGFEGGTDLSGGQWQKVALARALAAVRLGAGVLVLDEPTASLDVRAEADVFERLLDATRGVTTILVSHRFNTVRRADRIAVIEGGQVAELGTHAELMELDGRYASMYRVQAARFASAIQEADHADA